MTRPDPRLLLLALALAALPLAACHHDSGNAAPKASASAPSSAHTAQAARAANKAGPPAAPHAAAPAGSDDALSSGSGPRSLPPPSADDTRMAPAVGQWAKYHLTDGHGKEATVVYKIVGRQGDDYWLEVDTDRDGGHSSKAKMLVNLGASPSDMHVKDAWLDMNGHPMHLQGPMLQQSDSMLHGFLHGVSDDMHSDNQEDVTVPAGTFRGCYRKPEDVQIAGIHARSTLWRHPAVPILSLVQSKSEHGQTVQLVDYGTDGARSTFPS